MSVAKLKKYLSKPFTPNAQYSQYRHPVLLSDSKGYTLSLNHQGVFPLELWCHSGAGSENRITCLEGKLPGALEVHHRLIVYVWVGTCDVTRKDKDDPRLYIRNKDQTTKETIVRQIRRAYDIVSRYNDKVKLQFIDLQPASIKGWNIEHKLPVTASVLEDDKIIYEQVQDINKSITEVLAEFQSKPLNFSSFIVKSRGSSRSRNRYSVNLDLLKDGVHPGKLLSQVFTRTLQLSINKECFPTANPDDVLRLDPNSSEADEFDSD